MTDTPSHSIELGESDVRRFLEYEGPSSLQPEPIVEGVTYFDYRNTDENAHRIAALFSSQGIPFHIERPRWGWAGTRIRMLVTVPRTEQQRADAVLRAAAAASLLEIVKGTEGLYSR